MAVRRDAMAADALLLYPPASQPRSPHLALPLLQAFLESRGIGCDIADVNLACFEHFLSIPRLRQSAARIEARARMVDPEGDAEDAFLRQAERALLDWEFVRENLDESLRVLSARGPVLPGERQLERANTSVQAGFRMLSAEFFPARWEEEMFGGHFDPASCSEILRAVGECATNPFDEYCHASDLVRTLDVRARRFVGISICFQSQLIGGLTLARTIRAAMGPDFPIVIGGPVAMFLRRSPEAIKPLFDLVTCVVYGEGEIPLEMLHRALAAGRPLADVPGLLYRDGNVVRVTEPAKPPHLNDLPRPKFDQLPLERYLSNHLELPVFSERGCYYGKCTFCCVDLSPERRFDSRRAELLVADIAHYRAAHGATHALLITTALPAAKADKFAGLLLEQEVDVRWGTNIRYEDRFTDAILARMQRSGCVILNVGLESGSERIVQAMQKGYSIAQAVAFHQRAARAGIRVGLYIMVGFPGEEEADRQETATVLKRIGMRMEELSIGQFVLHEFAPMFDNPEAYGIEITPRGDQMPWDRTYRYTDRRAMPGDLVTPFRAMLQQVLEGSADEAHEKTPPAVSADLCVERTAEYAVRRTLTQPVRYFIVSRVDGSSFEVDDRNYVTAIRLADGQRSVAAIAQACNQPVDAVSNVVADLISNGILRAAPAVVVS